MTAQTRAGLRDAGSGGEDLVRLGQKVVKLALLRESPGRFARTMSDARVTPGYAECLCRSPAPRLVIRQRDGRYHLACWPGNGPAHRPRCDFYRPAVEWSGRGGYHREAIIETESGTSVQLEHSLRVRGAGGKDPASRPGSRRAGVSRATTGLLGMTHLLWENAQLNCWAPANGQHPARRGWAACHTALARAAADLTVNDIPADDALYVVPAFSRDSVKQRDDARDAFLARLHQPLEPRGIVVGEIKTLRATEKGFMVQLRQTTLGVFFPKRVWEKVHTSCRSATTTQPPAGARRILTALITQPDDWENLCVVDATVILTNDGYIPCDSSHEVAMADRLVEAGRTFVKPLRYDFADAVFPDFVLTDTPEPVLVEVWGIQGLAAYEQRKREKQRHYRAAGIEVIEWDATAASSPPSMTRSDHRGTP